MRRSLVLTWLLALLVAAPAAGQEPAEPEPTQPPARAAEDVIPLHAYLAALSERRLLAAETGSVERLRDLVRQGEELFLTQRYHDAALVLFEVAESPRFADFVELDEFRGAEFMLARSLEQLGALRSASRFLERIIARGSADPYFGPAYRKFVDVALASGDLAGAIQRVEALGSDALPPDPRNELRYLHGRERYDAGEFAEAEDFFSEITRRSRFFANAQYLRGAMAARRGDLEEAEARFCTITTTGDRERFTFYVDDRYFEVKDLARLALGRVAHEGGRADDAFYYYFQVPADSDRVAEALFEAAYSMYEGGDLETAVDLLDQLEVRFPQSPFVDEAALLRGYVHLGRCEFEQANRLFVRFAERFTPIVREVRTILHNPARQARLFEELLSAERQAQERERQDPQGADEAVGVTAGLLMAMLQVDPEFYRLHADVRTLGSEAARAGRLATELAAIGARVHGGDRPREAAEVEDNWDETAELTRDIESGRATLANLTEQIDVFRRAPNAPRDQVLAVEAQVRTLSERLGALERQLNEAIAAVAEGQDDEVGGESLDDLLRRDVAHARRMPARVARTRAHLVEAGNEIALRAVGQLAARLGGGLRRARIGRIDAVMGSKRRIEIQIESLSAGRFPPELRDPLSMQGLLRDDEEYWPFEGDLWDDEFEETDSVDEVLEEE